jgi:hypothetical protein
VGDASRDARVTLPYAYNSAQRVSTVDTTGPVSFATCGGPPELSVDGITGDVAWTPAAAGPTELCIAATDSCGTATLRVDIAVTGLIDVESSLDSTVAPVGARVTGALTVKNLWSQPLTDLRLSLEHPGLTLDALTTDVQSPALTADGVGLPSLFAGEVLTVQLTAQVIGDVGEQASLSASVLDPANRRLNAPVASLLEVRRASLPLSCATAPSEGGGSALSLAFLALVVARCIAPVRRNGPR